MEESRDRVDRKAEDGEEDKPRKQLSSRVVPFDHSVDNFFAVMDAIAELCCEPRAECFELAQIGCFSSMITFLQEWKQFYHEPKSLSFSYETESGRLNDVVEEITLTQFSAARVPKMEQLPDYTMSLSRDDFVLHVGGPIWALDWCPRISEKPDCECRCEYLAVASHPPGSSFHNIGVPLIGRGVIQIWCLVTMDRKEALAIPRTEHRGRGRPRIKALKKKLSDDLNQKVSPTLQDTESKKHRYSEGETPNVPKPQVRPSKRPNTSANNLIGNALLPVRPRGRPRKYPKQERIPAIPRTRPRKGPTIMNNKDEQSSSSTDMILATDGCVQPVDSLRELTVEVPLEVDIEKQSVVLEHTEMSQGTSSEACTTCSYILGDIAFPRVVLVLAHNGKVVWDVKWRPNNFSKSEDKQHIGYLAVLLGNGSLEVWEVPQPALVRSLYVSSRTEDIDPRFLKLNPVFRCTRIKCGDRQCIPLTVEWSPSVFHDLILAGCHDGTIALWKFSTKCSCQDSKPLLYFSADVVPIRALAWAPEESDFESSNLIITAGHEGLKFWDLRDPYRPLWELYPVQRFILSLDWSKEPRCIVVALEDGTLRTFSLWNLANDIPVIEEPSNGTKQQPGWHNYHCSPYALWNVQVSRATGLAAYCNAEGSTFCFQLSAKSEKDPRNRGPHTLCGSILEDGQNLKINTPLVSTPLLEMNHLKEQKRSSKPIVPELKPVSPGHGVSFVPEMKKPKPKELAGFPPKIVAMHRVRWNMNKGCEKWLCYGGAAGIVRCQEIT